MTGSSRPRLRSEISRGHSHDDLSEGTSARTRPSSYDEIMRRRKSKKQTDGFKEEVQETEHARLEESDKNLDHHSRDPNTAGINYSKNHAGESGYRKIEEKSSRMEDIHSKSKNKESHDSRSKHNCDKDARNGTEAIKTVRRGYEEETQFVNSRSKHNHDNESISEVSKYDKRGHASGRIDEESHDMDVRSKEKRENIVKNDVPSLEADRRRNDKRGHASGRIDEESHDMDVRSKEKRENIVKNDVPSLEADRRRNVRDKLDEENRDMDSRSRHKHKLDGRNDTEVSRMDRRGHVSGRINVERRPLNAESINKHEYSVKNSTPFEANRRRNIPDKLPEENRDMDSRSKHNNEKHVRSDTVGSKTDRLRHGNGRIDEEKHDMSAGPKDKHEKNAKNITPLVKSDTRGSVRDKRDEESHHVDSRAINKHVKHTSSRDEELKHSKQGLVRSYQGENLRDTAKYDNYVKSNRDYATQNRYTERSRGESESEQKRNNRSADDEKYKLRDSESEKKRKDRSADDEKYKLRDSAKKHDSGHRRDPEISERKEKKEFVHSRHDESKSKRRRSRSLEHPGNKDRRPRSVSPKARKNPLSHEHEYDPLSVHSQKERSKHNSDVDRSIMASNDSISHHRRHTGFSSGLGGYSPRKRKSDAAIKTPSPIRSPERNSAGRDLLSSEVDRNLSASVTSGSYLISQTMSSHNIDLAARTPVASSMGMPISTMFFHGLSTFQEPSIDSVQLTQATRPMRRLYVDNIPASASEKEIMDSFNSYLLSSSSIYVRSTRPCISCMIHKEKGQALLEFLTPEYASAALAFNGRSLYGSVLKIRRPKDYVEMTSGSAERLKAQAGKSNAIAGAAAVDVGKDVAISDMVHDSPNKIFVGGIADGLSSEMIMEIFSVLGPLKAFRFNANKNLNEPCVFLEYADSSITSKACAALNGMKLGGRILTVAQATPDASFQENFDSPPFYGIPEHVKPLLENPTLVLKLSNVIEQKGIELLPDLDLEEIMEDIRLECSRFGSVVSINAVITNNGHATNSEEKEVNNEELPSQPPKERESLDHLNMDLMQQVTMEHDGEANVDKPLTNLEGNKHDLATIPANEAEASGMSPVDVKETEPSVLLDCADVAVIDPQPIMTGLNEDTGIMKLGDSETCHADNIEPLDEVTGTVQEVARESSDSPVTNRTTETCEVGNVFELGCILVEFKRIEASCMAAHCLHGRLFDDRIVAVEYVPVEVYHARFPK